MFDKTTICLYHKQKGDDGKIKEQPVYQGTCGMLIQKGVREVLGGAENSADTLVHIPQALPGLACGDRAVLADGQMLAVHKCTVCPAGFYMYPVTILHLR